MPYTPAQRRLFFAQAARGEISEAEAHRRAHEGTRTDVDRTGHALRRKTRRGAKRGRRKLHPRRHETRKASRRPARRAGRRGGRRYRR